MTYYKNYEFTAFTEADLLKGGDTNLSCGDSFVMPANATTCITVTDNDSKLSGDYRDNATDHSGQYASIEGPNGEEIGNGGQIYAEKYFAVYDQYGNTYYLIEIEQENSSTDYFSFYGKVPPAGAELHVGPQCNVRGEWLDFRCLGAGDKQPPQPEPKWEFDENCKFTLEAEDFHLDGYKVEHDHNASGGELIKLADHRGYASTKFGGEDGEYNLEITFLDENDGEGYIDIFVNGEFVDCIYLNKNNGGDGWCDEKKFTTYTLDCLNLECGDEITLKGRMDGSEFARIDKVVFEQKKDDPGSLSGRYFCDTDDDDQDNGNGNEPGIANVLVTLLDADGNEILDANDQPITTRTDGDGNYSFTDLEPGTYGVKFTDPDNVLVGKELITPNVGNDASDSDAIGDTTMSTIQNIVVNAGEDTPDNDAGVEFVLGSLSGRYFCDDDRDGLDNDGANGGPSLGIAGVVVTLLDADGSEVLDANNQPVSVLTDDNGDYQFLDLIPGFYGVKFQDNVSGKVLTTQNADNNVSDDIDSDAADLGGGMSEIRGIEVLPNQDTPDNDAGVFTPNTPPEAFDLNGMLCADTAEIDAIVVNISDIGSDPDGDPFTLASIIDAGGDGVLGTVDDIETSISNGGSVTLTSGAEVRLSDDGAQVTYNLEGTGAFSDVLIRDTATDTFGFTISDGEFSDQGQVEIEVKGAKNTIETVEEGLPSTLNFVVTDTTAAGPGSTEAYTVTLSSTDARFDGLVVEEAYCLAFNKDLVADVVIEGDVYLATDDALPVDDPNTAVNEDPLAGQIGAADLIGGTQPARENLDLINWILNQDFGSQDNGDGTGQTYTDAEIQGAIWGLTDFFVGVEAGGGTVENALEIVDAAFQNGEGFEAQEGDLIGLFLDPTPASEAATGHVQPFIIAVRYEDLEEECVCPPEHDFMM